jgi:hypothetical protein
MRKPDLLVMRAKLDSAKRATASSASLGSRPCSDAIVAESTSPA